VTERLAGKLALISGAARGMGEQAARVLVREGANVVLGDILPDVKDVADSLDDKMIVNLSSVEGLGGNRFLVAYSGSKFAVRGMTKSAASYITGAELAVDGGATASSGFKQ